MLDKTTPFTLILDAPDGDYFFKALELLEVEELNEPTVSKSAQIKFERGLDPLRSRFNKLAKKVGVGYLQLVSGVIKYACHTGKKGDITKAKTLALQFKLKWESRLTNDDLTFLQMFDFPTSYDDYLAIS